MAEKFLKYNLQWPNSIHPAKMEMEVIRGGGQWKDRHGRTCGNGTLFHFREFIKQVWPWVKFHKWLDLFIESYHEYRTIGVLGPASSGKTFDAALCTVADWYCFAEQTTVICCSTTREMLENRVWGEIKRLHKDAQSRIEWLPGHLIEGRLRIISDPKKEAVDGRDFRNGMQGVPCKKGENYLGLGDFIGIKNKRVRLIGDELHLLPRVFVDSLSNLDKNPDFKAVGLGNPKDTIDALGVFAEPAADLGGWDSGIDQTPITKSWKTRRIKGICLQFPGPDSPNLDGKLGIPLITQEAMDRDISFYGTESLWYTMMNLGAMPRGQGSRRVLTRQMCLKFGAMEEPNWKDSNRIKIGFLDAAYRGVGGDRCVFGWLEFGEEVPPIDPEKVLVNLVTQQFTYPKGRKIIALKEMMLVPIIGGVNDDPEDQIANFVKTKCEGIGIKPQHFFYDSGMRTSLVQAFARLWSPYTSSVDCGGSPSERKVSADINVVCKDYYSKFITELWFSVRLIVEARQFRGMTEEVMNEFCAREWTMVGANKIEVETKPKMKLKCFIAGTLVKTPSGEVPIETLKVGDLVETPFGSTKIHSIHENASDSLFEIQITGGRTLCGTGDHKIFTWDKGWSSIDVLSLTSRLESVKTLPLWLLANRLFTRTTFTTFKHLVDIISEAGTKRIQGRREFYTELSGRTTLGLFLTAGMSIMSMVIGKTIASTISRLLSRLRTNLSTCGRVGEIVRSVPRCDYTFQTGLKSLQYGTAPKLGGHGIEKTGSVIGANECGWKESALFADNRLRLSGQGRSSAQPNAPTLIPIQNTSISLQNVWCAVKGLWRSVTNSDSIAVKAVRQLPCGKSVKVYDLTLCQHNAYYANGLLVSNCGRSPDLSDGVAVGCYGAVMSGFEIMRLGTLRNNKQGEGWKRELEAKAKAIRQSKELQYQA